MHLSLYPRSVCACKHGKRPGKCRCANVVIHQCQRCKERRPPSIVELIEQKAMVKSFRISLSDPTALYLAPTEIIGSVVVHTEKPKRYRSINISLKGRAVASWSTNVGIRNMYLNHSREDYVLQSMSLWDNEEGTTDDYMLPPGEHTFPFSFTLAGLVLPSSFEGTHGNIRYTLEARIIKSSSGSFSLPLKPKYKTVTEDIQITERFDINQPALLSPVHCETQKTICCLCWASGPISLAVTVPRTGYCAGEGVPVIATVQNRTTRLIKLRASINRNVVYRARGATFRSKTQLCNYWSTPVQGQSLYRWIPAQYLTIPETALTLLSSSIINVTYALQIEVFVPWTRNFSISVPIVVGNISQQVSSDPITAVADQF